MFQAVDHYLATDGGVVATRWAKAVTMAPVVQTDSVAMVRVVELAGCEVAWRVVLDVQAVKVVFCQALLSVAC